MEEGYQYFQSYHQWKTFVFKILKTFCTILFINNVYAISGMQA